MTGHNLDDEAAVLFGNVLHWHTEYLGRQAPVLPGLVDGFPKKVKPLVRLGEREMAAYCIVQRDRLHRRRVPDVGGQQAPRVQGGPQLDRAAGRPERRPTSTSASSPERPTGSAAESDEGRESLGTCERCGSPSSRRGLRVLSPRRASRRATAGGASAGGAVVTGSRLDEGEMVLLLDSKARRYLVTLTSGKEFHSHSGLRRPRRADRDRRGHAPCDRPGVPPTPSCGRPCPTSC